MSNDRLDDAIDRAVRDILDVEPPAGLRGRVLDRIEQSRARRWSWAWFAVPGAAVAAAAIAAVVVTNGRPATIAPPPFRGAADTRLAVAAPPPSVEQSSGRRPVVTAIGLPFSDPPRAASGVVLAASAPDDDTNFTTVAPLDGPAPIAIERLPARLRTELPSIEPAPLQIAPLTVTALPDAPPGGARSR